MHKDLGFCTKIQVVLFYILSLQDLTGKHGGHMVTALTFESRGPRSSSGERYLIFFLLVLFSVKTLYSYSASLRYRKLNAGGNPAMD